MFYLLVSIYFHLLFRKDKDVYEHERLSNFTLRHKVNEQPFYCCSTFHSHNRVFYNENTSYPIMSVKRPLDCRWAVLLILTDKSNATSGHLHYVNTWCKEFYFRDAKLSTRKQTKVEVILQIHFHLFWSSVKKNFFNLHHLIYITYDWF